MSAASNLTLDACDIFAGPNAAKRMARAIRCSVRTCEDYLANRRRLSLDAAIKLSANNEQVREALLARIMEAKSINEAATVNRRPAHSGEMAPAVRGGSHEAGHASGRSGAASVGADSGVTR